MSTAPPDMAEAAAWGITQQDLDDEPPLLVWPDNVAAIRVFTAMSTQWNYAPMGMGGSMPTGMNYCALPEIWRRTKTHPKDRDHVFDDLQVMEGEALKTMNEQRAKP